MTQALVFSWGEAQGTAGGLGCFVKGGQCHQQPGPDRRWQPTPAVAVPDRLHCEPPEATFASLSKYLGLGDFMGIGEGKNGKFGRQIAVGLSVCPQMGSAKKKHLQNEDNYKNS